MLDLDPPQVVDLLFESRRHWFKVYRFETEPALHKALYKDKIRDFDPKTIAYTDCYAEGEECGRMYLLDKSVKSLAHEAVHMADGILARHGYTTVELTAARASGLEEDLAQLAGHITSELYSQQRYF